MPSGLRFRRCLLPVLLAAMLPAVAGAQSPDISELTVARVQADYTARRYSAADLTRAMLARIARYESHYNAFVSLNPTALAEAIALDTERATLGPRGPLHGVPVVIKDNIDLAGMLTTAGWSGFSSATGGIDLIPGRDAAVVTRLRQAGAIILGKTNMPDFAGNGTHSRSTVAGVTLNPYAVDRIPGGSSGGTATAVNASFAVLGLGTETGGSIQNPASAQGLVGMKPTFGLVPTHGVVPIDATYKDVVGPIARTTMDAAIVLDIIAGPTPDDLRTYAGEGKRPANGYAAVLSTTSLQGKRFGLVGPGWRTSNLPMHASTADAYRRAVAALVARGAEVVDDPFAGTTWVELYRSQPRVSPGAHDMALYLAGLGDSALFRSAREYEALAGRNIGSSRGTPVEPTATEASDAFQAWRRDMRALFRKVMTEHRLDGLFFPQASAPITKLVEDPARPEYTPNNHPEIPSNIINDIGLPTVTLPFSYYADGTPFAVAFIGDLWTDASLLSWAHDLELATRARRAPVLEAKRP